MKKKYKHKELELLIAHLDNDSAMLYDTRRPHLGAVAEITKPGLSSFNLSCLIESKVDVVKNYKLLGFVVAKNGRRVYGVLEKVNPGFFTRLLRKIIKNPGRKPVPVYTV